MSDYVVARDAVERLHRLLSAAETERNEGRESDVDGVGSETHLMAELRAPDPTLSALPADTSVWIDDLQPRVAHAYETYGTPCGALGDDTPEYPPAAWHEEAQDARWFAVPCRNCFPDAPPPGCFAQPGVLAGLPHTYLSWQVT